MHGRLTQSMRVGRQRFRRLAVPLMIGALVGASIVVGPIVWRFIESGGLPPDFYDLQASLVFANSTSGLIYTVNATEQTTDCGYGVAYLLNGYTPDRHWYQVGLSWNWRGTGSGRFAMNYNVFDSNGTVIDPASGGGGVTPFSGEVSQGDPIRLVLAPASGVIQMNAVDLRTGAVASTSYQSFNQSSFGRGSWDVGRASVFTGLMTECYRGGHGNASWKPVAYLTDSGPVPFAAFCVGEWNFSNGSYFRGGSTVFPETCSSIVSLSSPSPQMYSAHGVVLTATETMFASGS